MSENIKSNANKSKECDRDEQVSSEKGVWNSSNLEFAEKAKTTFQELCKTLQNEQNKLFELETRRKKLQEEMLHLKAEIEEEIKSLHVNIEGSVSEQLNALNNENNISGLCNY